MQRLPLLWFSILLVLIGTHSFKSQNQRLDSLTTKLITVAKDSNYIITNNALITEYQKTKSNNYKSLILNCFYNNQKANKTANFKKGLAKSNELIGYFYQEQKIQDSALYYYQKAIEIYELLKNQEAINICYYRIARIYFYLEKFIEANSYITKTIQNHTQSGNKYELVRSYMFKAVILQNINDSIKISNSFYKNAIVIAEEINHPYLGVLYSNYGDYLNDVSKLEESFTYSNKAYDYAIAKKDSGLIAYSSLCKAKYYNKQKQFEQAKAHLVYPLQYWQSTNSYNDVVNASLLMSEVMYGMGNYKESIGYLRKSQSLKDSLNLLANKNNLNELETKYNVEKKDKELLLFREKEISEKLEKQKQENKNLILLIGITISLLFGGFALFAFINKRKANKLLNNEKKLVVQQKEILEIKNKEILDSINYAKHIQNAILPSDSFFKSYFNESFILYKPKDIVAGDFYWMFQKNDSIYLAVCDCTGHGVPGALVSVVCSNSLERALNEFNQVKPGEILDKTRQLVKGSFSTSTNNINDGMDISLIRIPLKKTEKEITVEWAGANNPLWYVERNEMKEVQPDKQPIGTYSVETPFKTHTLILNSGSVLYLFTDGYADQFGGPKGKKFKYKPFNDLLLSNHAKHFDIQFKELDATFENWRGTLEQVDDVCVVGIQL